MPIRSAYNDPNIGAAMSNIAEMFAPPASGDLANYALAKQRNQQSGIISKLAADPRYAGFDYQSILADLYDPTQSFSKVSMDDATARRGQDVTAATSRSNNAADNQRQFVTEMFQPLAQGETRTEVPGSISSMFGVDQALPQVAGAPKPLSETEVKGAILQDLSLTPEQKMALGMADVPVEQIDVDGVPQIVYRSDAVGKQAYVNKGSQPQIENAVAKYPTGQPVPARQRQDGVWLNAQTGDVLPDGFQIFKVPQAQGTANEVGLTTATNSNIQQQLIDITVAKDTATKLRGLIASAPASQGIVGFLRGTAQNVIQTGGELGEFFGGQVAEVADDIKNGLADADLAGAFDANIPAIEMLSNLLAFQYAKTTTGERLSNEMLRAAKDALGLNGLDANQANSLARLDQAIAQINAQQQILQDFNNKGMGAVSAAPDGVPAPAAPMQQPIEEWVRDPATGKLVKKGG